MSASPRERETFKERIAVNAHRVAEKLAIALPETWSRRIFSAVAAAAYHLAPGARRIVAANLSRVLGRPATSALVQRATKEAFDSYARYWHDTFRVRILSREELFERFDFIGREHLQRAADEGKGGLIALPHLGNWDAAGRWVHEQGFGITAVAEELKPERMYRMFYEHRRALGMGVVPLSEGHKVGNDLMKLLSENEFIALVCDRDLKNTGVEVTMFGERRRMPAGPALLALATGSPLMPCYPYDTDRGWGCVIRAPLEIERTGNMREDVTALTRKLAKQFEQDIAARPTQWHMFQPAWEEISANGKNPRG